MAFPPQDAHRGCRSLRARVEFTEGVLQRVCEHVHVAGRLRARANPGLSSQAAEAQEGATS